MVVNRPFDGTTDWAWFQERNPIKRVEDTCGVTAYEETTGNILAVMICDTWYTHSVYLHFAVDNSIVAKYGFAEYAFNYVFNSDQHPDTEIAYGFIPTTNKKAFKLTRKLGFEPVSVLSGGDKGVGFNIMAMKKDGCRHIQGA